MFIPSTVNAVNATGESAIPPKTIKNLKSDFFSQRLHLHAGTKWNAESFVHQHSCSVPVEATSKQQT